MTNPSRRRDFLNPIKAIRAFQDESTRAGATDSGQALGPEAFGDGDYLIHVSRDAMACTFQVYFRSENGDAVAEVAVEALELVGQLENQMTVYRSSFMTWLNDQAFQEPVRVESQLYQLLKLGRKLYDWTDGAFDMTSGMLTKAWGFFRREGRVPSSEELDSVLAAVGTEKIQFDDAKETVRFTHPDLEINLGGIGKGHALDRVADFMNHHGVENFLIHGGQSSVLAHGRRYHSPEPAQSKPGKAKPESQSNDLWKVGLRHPVRVDHRIAEICLSDRSIGTSGTGRQSFYHRGKRYGHIIDPRSGQPAEGVFAATAVAPTAAEADALATAFYVMGAEKSLQFCEQHDEYACLVVTPRRGQEIELHHRGFRPGELSLL